MKMNATGEITIHRTKNSHGYPLETCEWVGGRVAFVNGFVYPELPQEAGARFCIGQTSLRVIEVDFAGCGAYVVQERGLTGLLFVWYRRMGRVLEKIYRRSILTACIWGCANTKPENYPTWKDLHLPWRAPK